MILNRDSCIRIPIKMKNDEWVQKVLNHLSRKQTSYANKDEEEVKVFYDSCNGNIMIPRFYPVGRHGHTTSCTMRGGEDVEIKSNVTPRNKKQEDAIRWMMGTNEGVLCMKPGEGKTVVAIDVICKLGKKAIIFVHKNDLGKQWMERFVEHTELREENIGWLRSSSFKKDLSKPVVVSTVQTFCSLLKNHLKDFQDELADKFGVAIWDECHTSVSAEMFSKSSLHIPSRRVYGLSATPERMDGNTDIIKLHLLETYLPKGFSETLEPRAIMLYFDFDVAKKFHYVLHQMYLGTGNKNRGIFNKAAYLSKLVKSKKLIDRLKQVLSQISNSSRQALILSERINILEEIRKNVPKSKQGIYIGETRKDRDTILQKEIIFSTYQMSRDGLDIPRLDCVVFCTPVSNLEQAVGRIQRTFNNKKAPVVIDLVDSGSKEMMDRAKYRRRFYDSKGWTLEERKL